MLAGGFWVTYQQVTSFSREEDGPSAAGAALNRSLKSSRSPVLSRTFYSGSRSHAWKRTAAAFYLTDNFICGADNPFLLLFFSLFLRNITLPFYLFLFAHDCRGLSWDWGREFRQLTNLLTPIVLNLHFAASGRCTAKFLMKKH